MATRFICAIAALVSLLSASAASANSSAPGLDEAVEAYRAGDVHTAWPLLVAAAETGEVKAKRYLGYIILDHAAPAGEDADLFDGVALLKEAALAGDYASLIRLENLRRRQLAHSPTLADMIDIEKVRGEDGDAVAAWRLARRFELGEGVEPSDAEMAKWLEVAASAEPARFPKAGEAAYRLCELNALGAEAPNRKVARHWCAVAADNGHTGAAIVLRRLAQL